MRIGKWAEAKIVYSDTAIGKRGIIATPANLSYYKKVYIGKVTVPASSTLGEGGSVRVYKATHGLDSIVGGLGIERDAGAPGTQVSASVINASTMLLYILGYTAATTHIDVIIWGTSSA